MIDLFDPYYYWLAIPPEEQPPDHYRLLGLSRFERTPAVIAAAADRQIGYLRNFVDSERGELAEALIQRLSAVRACLLHAQRKAAYDAHLRTMSAQGGIAEPAAAEEVAPPGRELDGSVFGEYLLLDRIGNSRTGQVFKARHRTLGRLVALKVLSPEALGTPELRDRFYRKIKILARLSHPNLVALYDAGQREETHYMTMEYVDGQDLVGWMRQYGPIPVDLAVNYLAQAAAGLGYAHRQGVYHRNVKPGNILLDQHGIARVIGFGQAWVEPEGQPGTPENALVASPGRVVGTLDYMAPEQAADSNRVDGRTDVYSLGCTLYAVLTAQLPYPARWPAEKTLAHRDQPIPSIRALRADVPERLDAVFRKMAAKRAVDRYSTMAEAAEAMLDAVPPG